MEEQEAAYVVGQPNDCMAGSSSSYSSYTSSYSQSSNCAGSVDAPNERSSALIIPNYEIPADMPLMSIAPPPEQPKVIVLLGFFRDITKLPEYECYKSAETEKVTDIVDLLGVLKVFRRIPLLYFLHKTQQPPKASEDKVAFLRNVGHDPAFEELFKRYCAAGGLNSFANPVWLFHSLVTCFLGGDRWVELHEKLFPEYANSLKVYTPKFSPENGGPFRRGITSAEHRRHAQSAGRDEQRRSDKNPRDVRERRRPDGSGFRAGHHPSVLNAHRKPPQGAFLMLALVPVVF